MGMFTLFERNSSTVYTLSVILKQKKQLYSSEGFT